MAARDQRVGLVVELIGLTTSHGPSVRQVVREALLGTLKDPILNIYAEHLGILALEDGTLSIDDVHLRMIHRWPMYFAHLLPELQVHHGGNEGNIATIRQFSKY